MTELDRAITETALRNMFAGSYFDICTIDKLLKLNKTLPDPHAYQQLHALHCIHWKNMPQTVIDAIPDLLRKVLNGPELSIDDFFKPQPAVIRAIEAEPQSKRAGFLTLFR